MIRVLIVDGQAEVRWGLRMRLGIEPDMAVVGETGDVEKALALAQALDPDVIVVDTGMRGADGVNVVRRLRAVSPTATVVILTLHGDQDSRARAREAGAQAFLEKHGGAANLIETIRRLVGTSPLATRWPSVG
jgi:DNA-binding NarL/FixJ family response regulator